MPAASAKIALVGITDPFPGLRPFESDEEPIFRGRQQHTDDLLRRLSTHRFLAVVGTSGSGKSSLVRAGLLPSLERGYLAGATSHWRIAVMRPGMAPIENLADSLRQESVVGAADAAKLRSSRLGLVEVVLDAHLSRGESLLVVADQFEELFRYQRRVSEIDGGAEAAMFVSLLLTAVSRPDVPIYVVATMRSDFLGDCAQFPGLPEALSESQYLIPRLTREQRRQAIEEPLRLFGAAITPQLVELLLNDSGDEGTVASGIAHHNGGAPDPLPVLQHALMRSCLAWNHADRPMDLVDYRKAGRMQSALDLHAEHVFTEEFDDAGRVWIERIFRCLTTTELGRAVRRPTLLAELYQIVGANSDDQPHVDYVLTVLQHPRNSFIKIQKDTTVDISHESLIWKWQRLAGWVEKEAAGADLYRDLAKDANGKATWGEPKLSSALAVRQQDAWNEDWAHQYSASPFQDVEAFLSRSKRAVQKQKLLRWFALAAAVALAILGVIAYFSYRQAVRKARELDALKIVRNGLASDLEKRKQHENALADRISGLNTSQGATQAERDRIAKEKADLQAQLLKSQTDSQKLATQAQQSSDLLASVQSLQKRLEQAEKDRDDAVKRRDGESKLRQDAEAKIASLTRDLEKARASSGQSPTSPRAEPGDKTTPPPPNAAMQSPARESAPPTTANENPSSSVSSSANTVFVRFVVTDPLHRYVTGMEKEHFRIFEDKVEQEVSSFSEEDTTVSVGLVVDASAGVNSDQLAQERNFAAELFRTLNPGDECFLVDLSQTAQIAVPFSANTDQIQSFLTLLKARGSAPLLDAIDLAMQEIKHGKSPRKAIIVLSGGHDSHDRRSSNDVLNVVRGADVEIYYGLLGKASALSAGTPTVYAYNNNRTAVAEETPSAYSNSATNWTLEFLKSASEETGGTGFEMTSIPKTQDVADKIGSELHHSYTAGYISTSKTHNGKYRKLQIKVNQPSGLPTLTVRSRPGYYAPSQ